MARKPGTQSSATQESAARNPSARNSRAQGQDKKRGQDKKPNQAKRSSANIGAERASGATGQSAHGGPNGSPAAETGRRLREAFLAQLPVTGWRDLSYADIVAAADVPLAEAYQIYRTKMGVLRGVVQATDQAVLESLSADPLDGSPRDRLFDLIMRRLDQHGADKAAFSALLRDLRRQPVEALCLTARIERSMALLLDLAAVPSSGLRGALRIKALGALYLHVFRH